MHDLPNNDKFRFRSLLKWDWEPKQVDQPTVDPQLPHLDPLTRSAESIRYSILSIEFWISKDGQVREWLKNNTRLAVILAIPAFLILPIVTFALWQVVSWMAALASIAGKLIILPILVLLAALVIVITINIFKALFKN